MGIGLVRSPLNRLLERRASRQLRANFVWLTPELLQGKPFPSGQARLLAAMGIGSVLDLRDDDSHDESVLKEAGLRYRHLPMPELDPPTLAQLEEGVRWSLAEMAAGRTVLVHCRLGKSRSACMACAILIGQGHRLGAALNSVREARPRALLSERQLARLAEFEEQLSER